MSSKRKPQVQNAVKWDSALESLLNTKHYKDANVQWGDRNICLMTETNTFMDAISSKPLNGNMNLNLIEDPTRTKESHIRNMILKPLSPRKPIVIPCSGSHVVRRDKQKLEKIMKERSYHAHSRMIEIVPRKANHNVARAASVQKMRMTSNAARRPTYYWGA
ncbi:hypothetical protein TRFO_35045 [Tritrichomonas foetus]|uniref:Uncharacterized protein n=1 Tax=Tritrichomonas foetus TaxID=1144522 RepID=A0A1J4JLT8_9EUKA|nr:hypothetical protein TRFO_35045 [Tritrichomonas foetus]|eukprot:OHS98515.1 hypothetical protein TRFO_35045 [Tritrichomonas foetus]